jgi:hypothetical protein
MSSSETTQSETLAFSTNVADAAFVRQIVLKDGRYMLLFTFTEDGGILADGEGSTRPYPTAANQRASGKD